MRTMRFRDWTVYVAGGALVIAQTVDILAQSDQRALSGDSTISTSLAMSIVVWIVGAVLTYSVVTSRVAVIESRQTESDRRLERIENKLDAVLSRGEPS